MTRITTLIENRPGAHRSLAVEHGISMLIEHDGRVVLFDTGQSGRFVGNAELLGLDLRSVDTVVLSHGHYDHTNGVPRFVEAVGTDFELLVHRHFFDPKFSTDGHSRTYIGPSWNRHWCTDRGLRVRELGQAVEELAPGLFVISDFESRHRRETRNPRFVVQRSPDGLPEVDDFRDEVSLVLETESGLVVLVGCSHPGIMNMLDTVRERFEQPIYAVLGGTHLVEAQGERLDEAVSYLTDGSITKLGLSHCTGEKAMEILSAESSQFYRNVTGSSLWL